MSTTRINILFTRIATVAVLASCLTACVPASITVQGRLSGRDGSGAVQPDDTLSITHLERGNTDVRLRYVRSPLQDLDGVIARATAHRGLPFQESWHVLSLSSIGQRPGAEPVLQEFSADRGWKRDHLGDLAWLTLRHRENQIAQQNFSAFAQPGLRNAGALVLARQEDDDPVLPWRDVDGCGGTLAQPLALTLRVLAPGGVGDCFDMESLSSALLNQIAVVVTGVARDRSAIARRHRIAIVPHLPTLPSGPGTATAPGIGFIYEADLEPAIGATGVGAFTGTLTLSIPISLHWLRTANGSVLLLIDPIGGAVGGAPTSNVARVTVTAVAGSIAANFANELRGGVSAALATARLPGGPGGIGLPAFIDLFYADSIGLGGNARLPADFSVLALPTNANLAGAPSNVALSLGEIAVNDIGGFPANGAGVGARVAVLPGIGGGVRLTENRNAAGTRRRIFDLPAPVERLPFDFVLLR